MTLKVHTLSPTNSDFIGFSTCLPGFPTQHLISHPIDTEQNIVLIHFLKKALKIQLKFIDDLLPYVDDQKNKEYYILQITC